MKELPLKHVSRGIITNRDGYILLVKHASHKPYTLPGGHVEENETFQDALIREAREELDIEIELIGLVTQYRETNIRALPAPVRVKMIEFVNDRGPQRNYEEYFLAHYISGEITVQADEIADYGWFTLDEIRAMSEGEIYLSIQDIILSTAV